MRSTILTLAEWKQLEQAACTHPRIAIDKDLNFGARFWCKCVVCGYEAVGCLVGPDTNDSTHELVDGWTAKLKLHG